MTYTVAIDAGHGGKDPGAVANGIRECDIVLDVAHRVAKYIDKHYPDIKPKLTRMDNSFVELKNRTDNANAWGCDAFVSIHINAAGATSANGYESFIYKTRPADSSKLQKKLDRQLSPLWVGKDRADRGAKAKNFHVLRETDHAACLVELGFITNDKDAELLKDSNFLQENAEAIADGLADYFGVKKQSNHCDTGKSKNSLYAVIIDGEQKGAYNKTENVIRAVESAVKEGRTHIELKLT